MGSPNEYDLGGITLIAKSYKTADTPGQAGTEISATEMALLDGVTAGTAIASKVVTTNSSIQVSGLNAISGSITTTKASFTPVLVQQALSGAGAVNLTTFYTAWTTTGADAGTLADSTQVGHLKKVKQIVDGGDGTLTFNTNATIVFADAGDYAVLVWNGSDWIPIELGNDADGATAPVYTPAS
jgi:hypothetical protein